jgi:hypothetical protein
MQHPFADNRTSPKRVSCPIVGDTWLQIMPTRAVVGIKTSGRKLVTFDMWSSRHTFVNEHNWIGIDRDASGLRKDEGRAERNISDWRRGTPSSTARISKTDGRLKGFRLSMLRCVRLFRNKGESQPTLQFISERRRRLGQCPSNRRDVNGEYDEGKPTTLNRSDCKRGAGWTAIAVLH